MPVAFQLCALYFAAPQEAGATQDTAGTLGGAACLEPLWSQQLDGGLGGGQSWFKDNK